jgi:hypothetical protein
MQYDRNGVVVRQTQPVGELRTLKKTIIIDSRDRDPTKFVKVNGGASASDPGEYVVYLPRPIENVVSIRLKSAVIAAPDLPAPLAATKFTDNYVLLSLEGLDKMDETAFGANRAGFVDNTFAKISNPNFTKAATGTDLTLFYNDNVGEQNITYYRPPISTLDRFHVTLKYHAGVATSTSALGDVTGRVLNAPITFGAGENSFSFEVEYLDNGFSDFSSFQTRLNYVR